MTIATVTKGFSLEDFMANPPDQKEWVDGQVVEKIGITVKHSRMQSRLNCYWTDYRIRYKQGGAICVSLPCRTNKNGRRPDVSYLTPQLLEPFRDAPTLPQSPPLIGEIASPTDSAEELFAKAREYLYSGCLEVWLVFPESRRILIITHDRTFAFELGDVVSTQLVLLGFSVAVDELLA